MLSGFDPSGRALQFELRPMVENGSAGEAATTWIFGRDKARAQFVIDDGSVSGAHAEITYEPLQGLTLRDLGSTNGTRLDGEMLGNRTVPLTRPARRSPSAPPSCGCRGWSEPLATGPRPARAPA